MNSLTFIKNIRSLQNLQRYFLFTNRWIMSQSQTNQHTSIKEPVIALNATLYTKDMIDLIFHDECFKCVKCTTNLKNASFFIHQDKYICKSCYEKDVVGVCAACGDFLSDQIVSADSKKYHRKVNTSLNRNRWIEVAKNVFLVLCL